METKTDKYLLDPESVGITLDRAGAPTSDGWRYVTPGMWKFRWSVADKPMTHDSERPRYWDLDWYVDATKMMNVVELWEQNPDISPVELQSKAVERYLDNQKLYLRPYEMLIGNNCGDNHGVMYDIFSHPWMFFEDMWHDYEGQRLHGGVRPELVKRAYVWRDGKKERLTDEEFERAKKYSEQRNMAIRAIADMSGDESHMYFCPEAPGRYFEPAGGTGARESPDLEWALPLGLRRLVDMTSEARDRLKKELGSADEEKNEELQRRIINCDAMIRSGEAIIRWIKRQGEYARKAASTMPDKKTREIAEQVAANCEWVAENPPRTFWEAMQLFQSLLTVYHWIELACNTGQYLFDRIFWPWFKRDVLDDRTLSKVRASEILACHFAKWHEMGATMARFSGVALASLGTRDWQVFTIGGQDRFGRDATTDLTRLIIDTIDGYRFHYPDFKWRWHSAASRDDLKLVAKVARTGMGSPSVRNDEVAIKSMLDMYPGDITLEEARSWAVVGCNTPGPTIHSKGNIKRDAFYPQITKAVEFAIYNGRDTDAGFEWFNGAVKTGDSSDFKDFEEFYQAWLKQWEWLVTTEIRLRALCFKHWKDSTRRPSLSLLYENCVRSGDDVCELEMPRLSFQSMVGWVDSVDSLIAVKYCIFDKKMYTMDELKKALKANWAGYEKMQQDFKDAPKFGNDEDYADDLFNQAVSDVYWIGRNKVKDEYGKPVYPNALPLTFMYMHADNIGALPNGRKRGEPLADSGIAPYAEFDRSGPWSRLSSALKIDQAKFKAWIWNQRFDYSTVEGESGLEKLTDYLESGLRGGQSQMQFNFESSEKYKDAQKNPEKYPHLAVRISGYSCFFVTLPEFMQNSVIARHEHQL